MLKIMTKLQKLIESIPWYIYGSLMVLGIYNVFQNAESSVTVIYNAIGIYCILYVIIHNLEVKPS